MGEKFAANPVTGTGSMTVPIVTSPGRSGFGPQLSLSYDSGSGNGPFGFGWSLPLPSITRKTDKGLPQYLDAVDSDVFILSGAEDLVPVLVQDANGKWVPHDPPQRTVDGKTYRIRRYRPRIEGLFARIERWTNQTDPKDVFWRSISKDNISTWYGKTAESRIQDPADPARIFSWLICQSYDDKGNAILYEYAAENDSQVDRGQVNEAHRTRVTQRYLKRIKYGNRNPNRNLDDWNATDPSLLTQPDDWMFEVVFDYDDKHYEELPLDPAISEGEQPRFVRASAGPALPWNAPQRQWATRHDPFSTYRAGFEVRTYRLCQRVLMFHHFPGEPNVGKDCLVRSTDFTYEFEDDPKIARAPIYSFLTAVTQSGYVHQGDQYLKKSLPPVEFEYSEPIVQDVAEEVDPESLDNLPIGLDGGAYRWTDLHGEGIPGILTEQAGTWFYKRNLSPIPDKMPEGRELVRAKFAPLETVAAMPNVALSAGAEFMDLAGDGQPDVVVMDGPIPGLYEHDEAESWQSFRPFTSYLNRAFRDPNIKLVDLDGDGHADALITENDAFVWHPSLAEAGFGPARRVAQALNEEKGPRIVFADGTQSIYLADLSGDGLTDIVRIRNGEVCYWPNLGYGRFGAKVTMDNAPWFDHPDQFDHQRIRLADIDGSGTTDIIYLSSDGVRLYFNQSGNSWSQPSPLNVFPRIDDVVSIVPTDLLGNGTACLVWSSSLPGDVRRPMRYVNLMGSRKPHLLVKTINNLGAGTRVAYAPSTKFYLQDKRDGKPWITRLPFPVHVVERVETYDHISRNRFVTRYAYHHGYFDGEEREFRGFGMVEQWDTEELSSLAPIRGEGWGEGATNADAASHVPPVHTKTWFHTGASLDGHRISQQFEHQYYREPSLRITGPSDPQLDFKERAFAAQLLPDTILPPGLTLDEQREACRALKGSMLRQEVYADDAEGPDATPEQIQRAHTPYTVTEQNFTIRVLQPRDTNRHAVIFTHPREVISYHYERNPADPRIQHALIVEVDDYGNVLKSVAIGYGRRQPDASLPADDDRDKQALIHITYTENVVTDPIIAAADHYRTPLPAESRTYELRKPQQETSGGGLTKLYRFDDLLGYVGQAADSLHDIAYEDLAFARAQQAAANDPAEANRYFRRLIEHVRTLYRPDDCGAAQNNPLALLALKKLENLALPGESYKLAFTPGLLDQVFVRDGQKLLPADPADFLAGSGSDRGGYVDLIGDGHWWLPAGRSFFSTNSVDPELAQARRHFFLPRRYRDPFGQDAFVDFDANDLLMVETRDALNNRITVNANDYRVLQPCLVSDPNRNRTEVAFDTLGMVVGTAVMGKPQPAPAEGDSLAGFVADLTPVQLAGFFEGPNPHAGAVALLQDATTRIVYDLDRFRRTRQANPNDPTKWQPTCAATLARETHVNSPLPPQGLKIQISFSYSDGFGREIQKKIQAEPDRGLFVADVLADQPIAYYRLNEVAGSTRTLDLSGNGHHGDCSPTGITLEQPGLGVDDKAIRFDGQGSGRIVVPDSEQLNPKHITVEALVNWFGPTGSTQQRILEKSFSAASPTWPTYGLSILANGSVRLELVISGHANPILVTSQVKVTANVATHVAATYDGHTIEIHVNGVLDTSLSVVGAIVSTFNSSKLGIGNQVERNRQFNGVIDEVVLYDQALAAVRIRSHFAKVKDGNEPRRRWVGSGWTIFNNKGKPVRQYEPFFSPTHRFEFGSTVGVSPVLFYDPAERVIATLHPNHTYEKVLFDPWQQTTYDVNDTCAPRPAQPGDPRPPQTGDPRTDPDIGGYVREYFKTQPATWKTWHAQRISGALGSDERNAAGRAAAHAETPTTAHFDALGRPFLTLVRNRVVCPGHDRDGTEDSFATRVELDIEGNQRKVFDERKLPDAANLPLGAIEQRIVMRYAYDMLGNRIHQQSMEAGARWMLNDVSGKPIRAWDSRGHNFTTKYDALRRPLEQTVRGTFSDPDPLKPNSDSRTLNRDTLVDKIEYGEGVSLAGQSDQDLNLRTRIYRHLDSAGEIVNAAAKPGSAEREAYDFKGNLLRSTRRLVKRYKEIPDWSQDSEPQLDGEAFEGSTRYDALNRPIQSVAPHSSLTRPAHPNKFNVIQPLFNEANLLERVDVWLERAAEPPGLLDPGAEAPSPVGVADIDYDAKGQRQRIDYKNGASTFYSYDPLTFRLTQLLTKRKAADFPGDDPQPPIAGWPGKQVQNLWYTYDPVGNITHIQDDAQQTIYFKNQRVEPSNDYTYDALYRLIQATGREHLGQLANGDRKPPTAYDAFNAFHIRQDQPNMLRAMGTYTERYVYDAVGNFLQIQHRGTDPAHAGWTRAYTYNETSLIEPSKQSNRLSGTQVGNGVASAPEAYLHDAHGNMLRMPHLGGGLPGPNMHWDYKDQLRQTDLGGGGAAFYVYDASGQRVRKVWEKSPGLTEERIYLGGFEIFRKHGGPIGPNTATLERETLHVMDDKQRIALVETRTLPRAPDPDDPLLLIHYQFGNHLGSASLELDEQGQIISYEEYAPYGSSTYQAVRSQTETSKRYRYTGKERDEESGLYYHGARYYAPWLGKWTSCDPVQLADGLNLYSYVRDNPVLLFDPTGKAAQAGHYRSVYLAALIVGYEPEVAAKMAFYAQMPDQVRELDAKEAGTTFFLTYVAKNADSKMKQISYENAVTIQAGGHSITGDVAEFEQGKRREIVLSQKPGSALHGAALHAFTDAFFHERESVNAMVKPPLGHGPFTEFDLISRHPDRWEQSFRALIDVLGKQAPEGTKGRLSEKEIDQMIREIKNVAGEWRGTPSEASEAGVRHALESWTIRAAGGGNLWLGLLLTSRYEPEKEELMTWDEFRKAHPELTKDVQLNDILEAYKTWAGPVDQSYESVQIDQRQSRVRLEGSFKFPILSPVEKY